MHVRPMGTQISQLDARFARLAVRLHFVTPDEMSALLCTLFSGAGLKVLEAGDLRQVEDNLKRINQGALQALGEMRLLIYELRPASLDEGLASALENRLNAVERRSGVTATLAIRGDRRLDRDQEMALFRIAEEALNNALKHAHAKQVRVQLDLDPQSARLEVADDGRGFDPQAGGGGGGMGLNNMRARAAELGGEFQLTSAPDEGTRVVVRL